MTRARGRFGRSFAWGAVSCSRSARTSGGRVRSACSLTLRRTDSTIRSSRTLAPVNGCDIEIELYKDPIEDKQYVSVDALERAIREQIEFMVVPVFFNGKRLNKDPKGLKWTAKTTTPTTFSASATA
jgi:hypothetical protein